MADKLTKSVVEAAKKQDGDSFHWDEQLKGFGLKVTPTGRKVYIYQYRLPGRPTRRYTIGVHGGAWTPDGARQEVKRLMGQVARGLDPAEERKRERSDPTLGEVCDRYLRDGVATKKASTAAADRARIERHIKPLLGRKKLSLINRADISRFLTDVAAGKTAVDERTRKRGRAIVTGGKAAANRALATLSAVMAFAVDRGLRVDNPVRGTRKFKEGKKERFLSNAEIARLGEALKAAEAGGTNPYAIAAIRLLVLTGCRKNEILSLKWDEVDVGEGFLRLADSKTGAKVVHLGAPARALLASLPRHADNPFVMCGDRPGSHLVGLQKIWAAVRETAQLSDVRLHDLRHSFASVAARSGESLLVIGKVLGHSTTAATGRYAHLSDDPVRNAAENTGAYIAAALTASAKRPIASS